MLLRNPAALCIHGRCLAWAEDRTLVCNEEGKLEGLPLNRALRDEDGDIYSFLKLRNAAAAISEGGCVLNGSLH